MYLQRLEKYLPGALCHNKADNDEDKEAKALLEKRSKLMGKGFSEQSHVNPTWLSLGLPDTVMVRAEDTKFKCQLMLLYGNSKYFLKHNPHQEIVLPAEKVTADAFDKILRWMSGDKSLLHMGDMVDAITAANFLEINQLMIDFCDEIENKIQLDCKFAYDLFVEAKAKQNVDVKDSMLMSVGRYFLNFVASAEFLQLTTQEVQFLFSSSAIGVYTELEVLFAAIYWCEYNKRERKHFIKDVLTCVRFSLLTTVALESLKRMFSHNKVEYIYKRKGVKPLINYKLALNKENSLDTMFQVSSHHPPAEQRDWIVDTIWPYHKQPLFVADYFNMYNIFKIYLALLKNKGPEHWRTFQKRKFRSSRNELI